MSEKILLDFLSDLPLEASSFSTPKTFGDAEYFPLKSVDISFTQSRLLGDVLKRFNCKVLEDDFNYYFFFADGVCSLKKNYKLRSEEEVALNRQLVEWFLEGVRAAKSTMENLNCPYSEGSQAAKEWLSGFNNKF